MQIPTNGRNGEVMDLERKKALEASVLFVTRTRHCGAVKLFKLLYFLDMLHFRETGRTVTGLTYTALPYGPVPLRLLNELDGPPPDLMETFDITRPPKEQGGEQQEPKRTLIQPKVGVRDLYLTVREKKICGELIDMFLEATADQMSEVAHAKNGPWDKAKAKSDKWKVPIDFRDALSPTLAMGSGKALKKALMLARAEEFEQEKQRG